MYRQAMVRMVLLGFAFASILSLGGCSPSGGDGPGGVTGVEDTRPTAPTGAQLIEVYASHDNTVAMSSVSPRVANTVYQSTINMVGCSYGGSGQFQDSYSHHSSALMFDVQQEITGRSINSATLRLYGWDGQSIARQMYVSAIGQDWDPATLTYNTLPQVYTGSDISARYRSSGVLDIDVSVIVSSWASGTFGNYGFMLMDHCAPTPRETRLSQIRYFGSLEVNSLPTERPLLIIEFN